MGRNRASLGRLPAGGLLIFYTLVRHEYSRIFPMGRGSKLFTSWSGDLRTNFAIVRLCSCASGSPLI